ncbi:DEBR0S2_14400g1_1 [Brettanomyces bruxellensis]|uniref:DEBR0S2_14400g1_1 n=1 Tax=Dekkera bruxellensis TaxID=5007 RepID=A0A7D9H0R3_DEKBR|nr:DEBR0S2_14400g1_1 [Brettanomyces bruxellensis]
MTFISQTLHIGLDLALIAGFFAGVKKSTGLQPNFGLIEQPDVQKYSKKYFELGDKIYNKSVDWMGESKYFIRK